MIIKGLQKLTLLDFPGHVACTIFTSGCNYRCPFCHNASLALSREVGADYSEDEILSFLSKRVGMLDGVAITGGEPLIWPDITDLLKKIKDLGFKIKLDTNGTFPERLREIIDRGLVDYVAIDIKNSPERYAETVGKDDSLLDKVRESVNILMDGEVDYEFRTTVVDELHTADDIRKIGEFIKGAKRWYLQNFVDSGDIISSGMHAAPEEKMREFLEISRDFVPSAELRGI